MERDRQRRQASTGSIADLWEHACLLFHSFEWQSAADTFLQLEQRTSNASEKCIFALNRGLIEARLGDPDLALTSFYKALRFEGNNSVAHFLLGLVCAETGDYADGLMHFEHCLKSLHKDPRTYRTNVGYFQLGPAIVIYNIDRMRLAVLAAQNQRGPIQPRLQTIPAQIIFEAPLSAADTSETCGRFNTGVLPNIEPSVTFDERLRDPISQALQPTYINRHDIQSLHLIGDQDLNLVVAPGHGTQNATSPRTKLAPRDARTSGESVREMAQFLRHVGPSGDSTVTVNWKYMQSLLQSSNRNSATRHHVRGQLSASSSTSHLPDSPASRDSDFHSLLGLYIGSPRMRRSLPLSSGTPSPTTILHEQPVGIERSNTTVVRSPTMPHARRPSLAERWLRKEVSPSWVRRPSISQPRGADNQISRSHARTTSPDDGESLRSAPSVVSSVQFFRVGGPLRRPGL